MADYIIGIDAGTSIVKSILFGAGGVELFSVKRPVDLIFPGPGLVEQDMNVVWESVYDSMKELIRISEADPQEIAAIAITAQGDGTFFVGYDGEAVGNSINWMDGRAAERCMKWEADGTMDKIYSIGGCSLYPGTTICLSSWLVENDPEKLENTKWICCCKDWLKYKMTNEMTIDDSLSEFANVRERRIDERLMEIVGVLDIKSKFPPMKRAIDNHAPLDRHLAAQLGLKPGIPVFGGPFDIIACAIGVGNIHKGDSCAVIGTTCMVEFSQDSADSEPAGIGYTLMHSLPKKWIRAFGVMAGTPNLDWAIATFGQKYAADAKKNGTSVFHEIEQAIEKVPAGSEGVVYHPFISPAGERSPFVKSTAKAQFFGIGGNHTSDHLMRAVYEGVGYSVLDCFESYKEKDIKELRLTGGGSKSRLWCQMFADIIGIDVITTQGEELGAKGAALVAGTALGLYGSLDEAVEKCVQIKERFIPNKETHEVYKNYYKLYKSLIRHVWEDWDYRGSLV